MVCRPVAEIEIYSSTYRVDWVIDILTHKVFELDLNRVYEEEFWRENVPQRY